MRRDPVVLRMTDSPSHPKEQSKEELTDFEIVERGRRFRCVAFRCVVSSYQGLDWGSVARGDHGNHHKSVIQASSKASGVSSAKSVTAIDLLLDSDPAIRWQVMRDLTDAPPELVAA